MVRGSNRGWDDVFGNCPDRPLGPTQPPVQRVPGHFHRGKATRAWRRLPTPTSTEVKERGQVYRVSQEEWTKLRESVPYVELYRYNPKHLYPKLNGYGDNAQRSLKL